MQRTYFFLVGEVLRGPNELVWTIDPHQWVEGDDLQCQRCPALAHLTPMEALDVGCDVCICVGPVVTLCWPFFGPL
jgi:hypothetical protein